MLWADYIGVLTEGRKITCLASATNGLDKKKDKLLGVWAQDVEDNKTDFLLNMTRGEELQKSQAFHKLSEDLMASQAFEQDIFVQRLADRLRESSIILTYSIGFQEAFLLRYIPADIVDGRLFDITPLLKMMRSRMAVPVDTIADFDDLYSYARQEFGISSVYVAMGHMGLTKEVPPGHYPAFYMVSSLAALWRTACQLRLCELSRPAEES